MLYTSPDFKEKVQEISKDITTIGQNDKESKRKLEFKQRKRSNTYHQK